MNKSLELPIGHIICNVERNIIERMSKYIPIFRDNDFRIKEQTSHILCSVKSHLIINYYEN